MMVVWWLTKRRDTILPRMKDHFKTAWTHIRRAPYQALGATAVMFLTFITTSLVVLLAAGFQGVLTYFETRPQVIAFFKDEESWGKIIQKGGKINVVVSMERETYGYRRDIRIRIEDII